MYDALIARLPDGRIRFAALELRRFGPGLLVSLTIAMAATFLSDHYGGPVMLFALLLGIAFNFLSSEGVCKAGIGFTSRTVLRFGVGLLGARITVDEVLKLGPMPVALAIAGVTLTIGCGVLIARMLGFNRNFGVLTGGAVGICGASAALAIASVMPRGKDSLSERDTIFTVIGVTALSTIAMVIYPIIVRALGFDDLKSGVFLGATIHDVAQVVGAGYSISKTTGDAATLTKLLRVAMLVPVVIAISYLLFRKADSQSGDRPSFPFFLIAFVALVAINSFGLIPAVVGEAISSVSRWALVAAIAALGMKTALGELAAVGPKALALLVIETTFIAILGLIVVGIT